MEIKEGFGEEVTFVYLERTDKISKVEIGGKGGRHPTQRKRREAKQKEKTSQLLARWEPWMTPRSVAQHLGLQTLKGLVAERARA